MRVCFTSDIHGNRRHYTALAELIRAATPDLVVLGGDLVRDIDPDLPPMPQVDQLVADFTAVLDELRAAHPPVTLAGILGNHEIAPFRDALLRRPLRDRFRLLDLATPWSCGEFTWVGYSSAPPSPHWAKDFERLDRPGDEIPPFDGLRWNPQAGAFAPVPAADHFTHEPTIAAELDQLAVPTDPWVLVAHTPPRASGLDQLPKLDEPIGSQAVRDLIERARPAVSLHGHIHEGPLVSGQYAVQIGETLAINPGQGHDRLHAVLFDPARPHDTLAHTVLS